MIVFFTLSGYLGYTSGLSLLCMVFFLIVVSMTHLSSFLMLAHHRTSFTHILWPVLVLPIGNSIGKTRTRKKKSSSEIPSSYTTERDSFVLKKCSQINSFNSGTGQHNNSQVFVSDHAVNVVLMNLCFFTIRS